MRKHFMKLFALTLALLMLCTSALALECTCGQQVDATDNYCRRCGMRLPVTSANATPSLPPAAEPTAAPTAELPSCTGDIVITAMKLDQEGQLAVTWSGGQAPYAVEYRFADAAPVPFHWVADAGVTANRLLVASVVPGVDYEVRVVDDAGASSAWSHFDAPDLKAENPIGTKLFTTTYIEYLPVIDEHRLLLRDVKPVLQMRDIGLKATVTYSTLARPRTYRYLFALTAPNGVQLPLDTGMRTLPAGQSTWTNKFLPLNAAFDLLISRYGEVPLGDYTVTLYFNGAKVCESSFVVR